MPSVPGVLRVRACMFKFNLLYGAECPLRIASTYKRRVAQNLLATLPKTPNYDDEEIINNAMMKVALAAMADPEFTNRLVADIQAKRDALTAFKEGETFRLMLATFIGQPESCSVDSEEASYFLERVQKTAGWEFATKEDVDNFFRVVADSRADSVEKGSHSEDDDCPFDNESFRNYGLSVRRMSGQGTFISIGNR